MSDEPLHPRDLIAAKLRELIGADLNFEVEIPDSKFGDYASNAVLAAAKTLKQPPLPMAQNLQAKLSQDKNFCKIFSGVAAVAPGFLNFSLSPDYLAANLLAINKNPDKFGSAEKKEKKLVLVEYFQLNVAKPPHVGHLRSAVIGDSLKRIFISLGYHTVSDTHMGDWGTQFGIMLWAYKNLNGRARVKNDPLAELNALYIEANTLIEQQPEVREQAKAEFVRLEKGDQENRKLWQFFVSVSGQEFDKMVTALNLLPFEYNLGESFYEDLMKEVIIKLEK